MKMLGLIVFLVISLTSCDLQDTGGSSTYVKPSVDKNGRVRKGYVRKSVSTSKGAMNNQNRSRYYYHKRTKQRK